MPNQLSDLIYSLVLREVVCIYEKAEKILQTFPLLMGIDHFIAKCHKMTQNIGANTWNGDYYADRI